MVIDEKDRKYLYNGHKFLTAIIPLWIYFGLKAGSAQPTLFCSDSLFAYAWNGMQIIGFLFFFPSPIFLFYLKFFKYRKNWKEFNQVPLKLFWIKNGSLKYLLSSLSTVGILELISRFVCGS